MDVPLTIDIEGFSLKHDKCGIGTICFAWNKHEGIAFAVDCVAIPGADKPPYIQNIRNQYRRDMLKQFFIQLSKKAIYHNIAFDVYVLIYQLFMRDILDTEGLLEGISVMLKNWDCTCAFIDAEHALDVGYAQKLGVNLHELLISQPDTGEQALEICDALVRSGSVDLVVIDSVAALTPRAEIEGDMGDSLPGLQARLMSQALRKLTGSINRTNTLVIFINQIRMKIGVMFGSPETTTGGNALKFYASVRLDIRRTGSIKSGDEVIGSKHA